MPSARLGSNGQIHNAVMSANMMLLGGVVVRAGRWYGILGFNVPLDTV